MRTNTLAIAADRFLGLPRGEVSEFSNSALAIDAEARYGACTNMRIID